MTTRREFFKTTGIDFAATTLLHSMAFGAAEKKTGIGLYTVRDNMIKDPDGILMAIAEMGYNWIEAGTDANCLFYNIKPADFRKKIESFGMSFISSNNTRACDRVPRRGTRCFYQ